MDEKSLSMISQFTNTMVANRTKDIIYNVAISSYYSARKIHVT